MSATTEAYDLFSYELSKVKEKPRILLATTKERPKESTLPEAEIVFLRTTRRRAAVSPLIEDTQFHGSSYLFQK